MAALALLRRDNGLLRSAALIVALICGSVPSSLAAPITIGTAYQDNAQSTCATGSALFCFIDFAPVPSNKQLVLTHVTCQITSSANPVLTRVALLVLTSTGATTQHQNTLVPVQVTASGSNRAVNHPIVQLVKPTFKPRITANLTQGDFFLLSCNVMGTITDTAPPV